jgi:allantoicase
MGKGDRKGVEGGAYVVIGCLNGADDKPDLKTLRAFLATSSQGVSYDQGIWRRSLNLLI